jgi:multicomponent Na+:H+ antiporter subunit A
MPWTAAAAALAAGSMAGIPLFFGFIAKEQFYDSVGTSALPGAWNAILIGLAVAASMCLGAAGFIAGIAPFRGRPTGPPAAHDAPALLWIAPLMLGALGLALGIVPGFAAGPVALATASVTGAVPTVTFVLWHGLTTTLVLSMLTLAGSMALFALQSASLRAYVLTVVGAAIALVALALAADGALPPPRRWTPVPFHEGLLAALIVAGALSAAFARTRMAAVLSLGTVGYGVAVLYALLGAPDLAMTQFAVETLTVVIFVLVFYRLRGFGDLSSRLIKTRDALVASAAGALVTILVLFVGASGTSSRLADYFADAAPRLAHGRNVVNVILVDFRGFDTLGETTVLVTVAVGVRALLLIGRERRP